MKNLLCFVIFEIPLCENKKKNIPEQTEITLCETHNYVFGILEIPFLANTQR